MSWSEALAGAPWWRPAACWAIAVAASTAAIAHAAPSAVTPAAVPDCRVPLRADWPTTGGARRELRNSMGGLRQDCINDAPFLAAYGGLLLDDGDIDEALVWLERALLLDPADNGALVDFALALAEKGDRGPLRAVAEQLLGRPDLPVALRERMLAQLDRSPYSLPRVRLGGAAAGSAWFGRGEVALMTGHETNLDRSPRLTELTLTIPEGPILLPVTSTPRSGSATLTAASYEVGFVLASSTAVRAGLSAASRQSRDERTTDWRQQQVAGQLVHQWRAWRVQLDATSLWVDGPLGEPFRQGRTVLGLERDVIASCRGRVGLEYEKRTQSQTRELDAVYQGGLLGLHCVGVWRDWDISASWRQGRDSPTTSDRPGGEQEIDSANLRVTGPLARGVQFDAGLRASNAQDSTGYSPLLQNNAVRVLRLLQTTIGLTVPLALAPPIGDRQSPTVRQLADNGAGLVFTLEWQASRQRSNLPLFAYKTQALYAGLRYRW